MTDCPPQPKTYDLVLGGQNLPLSGAVLGGLDGVKQRLATAQVQQKINALHQALHYGQPGLELIVETLKDADPQIQKSAYLLLRERSEPEVKQALATVNPYEYLTRIDTLNGHKGLVLCVAFSPDGQTLATSGSGDKAIAIWDISSGKKLKTLHGHGDWVNAIAFNPQGPTCASCSSDGTIKIWDMSSGNPLSTLHGHTGAVYSLAYTPDGRTLVTGSADCTIDIWDLSQGRRSGSASLQRTLLGHQSRVEGVAVSPDGQILASGSWDRTIQLWDLETGQSFQTLRAHQGLVVGVAFSSTGKHLVSYSTDTTIAVWKLFGRGLGTVATLQHTLCGHEERVNSVSIAPDGRTLISGSRDGTIAIWDLYRGELLGSVRSHSGWVNSVAYTVRTTYPQSRQKMLLASGGFGGAIELWTI
ncbi:WD40 repeat domain-containing protein [Oxynema sp. CENA135]|uniref:WD40 repeat domain-containing protein n=1 Tax=Oxynema sp. CENA135 TaxID=984206 RepID=UPI00190AC617|nr:WD40 repeat domain-containing protein [Oxynema sp. CENA135]MBK4730292.1 WD40 repeat domain-containing protein [Oxynema sp. CENA135]